MDANEKDRPLYSSCADDASKLEAIDRFVVGLAERVDLCQDADARFQLTPLGVHARDLAADAAAAGFDALSRCAAAVEAACLASDTEDVHESLVELTEVARRVRLGHRGAV